MDTVGKPMKYLRRLSMRAVSRLMPFPVDVRHAEYSVIQSMDDEPCQPSEQLISVALQSIHHARTIDLDDISRRMFSPPYYPNLWPGEHYKLLSGLIMASKPALVIEIGTATGLSALAMKKYLRPDASLVTFDVVGWERYPGAVLRHDDFSDRRLVQMTDDLSLPETVDRQRQLLENAELIFIDAAKDGEMEQRFIANLKTVTFKNQPLVVFDDIRLWNMLKIWRGIPFPKLDLTSFGHWSGTGFVEWRG